MSQTITQIRKQITEMSSYFLQNPLIEVEVYFNRLVVHYQDKNGQKAKLEHHASPEFANTRMIIADFEKALLNVQDIFAQIPKKWHLGKPAILVNVKENLADGLSSLESRALKELFAIFAQRLVVFYQDELFVVQVLDEREIAKAKIKKRG